VHGHGGTIVVALALGVLHNDVGCSYAANSFGERFHWYSSTGWVMWNAQVSGLLGGTTCVIFDGNPGGTKDAPDWTTLWRFAAQTGVTFFGAGAAFYANCLKAGVDLSALPGLQSVRALGSTGSPLSVEAQNWGTEQFRRINATTSEPLRQQGPRDWLRQTAGAAAPSGGRELHAVNDRGGSIWWCNISGGTDFAGAFIGGHRELPLVAGEMQCRLLGCAVEAWNEDGQAVLGDVGELVCSQPIPSMPLYFWGDTGGVRYLSSYFDMYPNVWRHGDWLKVNASGSCVIYGRSDATINRHGLRMGTSELYSAIEALPEVLDSMVVDLEYLGKDSYMPLFVTLRPGLALDDALTARLNDAIKTALSPRFVPNAVFQVPDIPRTLSGKKQELPIKKLLLGQPLHKVVNPDAMANPASLDWFVDFASRHLAAAAATKSGG
jgi:acetoacetyl-CoA synthetase